MKLLAFLILSLHIIVVLTKEVKKHEVSCERFCSMNYHPACGTNGACIYEFKNKCTMYNNNCEFKKLNKSEFKPIPQRLCYKPDNPCHPDDMTLE